MQTYNEVQRCFLTVGLIYPEDLFMFLLNVRYLPCFVEFLEKLSFQILIPHRNFLQVNIIKLKFTENRL